ncbi:MAG: hypothetical protein H6729_16710 [Deltaproteobacteria bacterium]|nr:hypothetical protein [Deltaproteobacteria bacterium]
MPFGALRVGAVLLLIFAGFAEGAEVAHALTTQHRLCLEHGELMHTEPARSSHLSSSSSSSSSRAVVADAQSRVADDGTAQSDETHHHCALLAASCQPTLEAKSETLSPIVLGVSAKTSRLDAFMGTPRAIFRLAPKNSPPSARLA